MSLRWRIRKNGGLLLCAAKCDAMPGDTYIDDRLHYQLAVIERVVIPDVNEKENGIWNWKTPDV